MNKEIKWKNIPEYGSLMSLQDWKDCVSCGGFIDYDGDGNLATQDKMSDIIICPSELDGYKFPDWCTHIMWFN